MGVACYLSYSKVKARDSTNFYNQASNSRAVLFERSEFTGKCAMHNLVFCSFVMIRTYHSACCEVNIGEIYIR